MSPDGGGPSPGHAFAILRRRVLGVILCALIAAGAAYGFSTFQAKQYTATASLLFDNNQLSQQVAGFQPTANNNQQSQQDTNVRLVQIGDMPAKTASLLGHGLTKQNINDDVGITPQGDTSVVDVTATSSSPTLAAQIANTYSKIFVDEQQKATSEYYRSALATVNDQLASLSPQQSLGAQGLALQQRAQSLATLAQLRAPVQLAQPASIPINPSSPRILKNVVVAGMLGLLVGIVIAVLLERFDQRIREPSELAAIYGRPVLGVVPDSSSLSSSRWRKRRKGKAVLSAGEADAFQLFRVQLRYFNVDHELRTLLVVSAAPGDGKSTIARRLAAATANAGSKVLLIEADFRNPDLSRDSHIGRSQGLSDVLIGAIPLEAAIEHRGVEIDPKDTSDRRILDVLVSGSGSPPNPAELLESHAMEVVMRKARAAYDFVIVDTPPLTVVGDAFPLLRKVDGVVIVAWVGRTRRDVAERLSDALDRVAAPLLGVVANGLKNRGNPPYRYGGDPNRRSDRASSTAFPPAEEIASVPGDDGHGDRTWSGATRMRDPKITWRSPKT